MPRREDATVSDRCSPRHETTRGGGLRAEKKGRSYDRNQCQGFVAPRLLRPGRHRRRRSRRGRTGRLLPGAQSDAAAPATSKTCTVRYGHRDLRVGGRAQPITDIASTVDTDILVIGAGPCRLRLRVLAAAENGGKVTVVGDNGQLQRPRRRLRRHQLPAAWNQLDVKVDKVNAKQHWIAQCASRTNEGSCSSSSSTTPRIASNWLLDIVRGRRAASAMVGAFYSHDDVYRRAARLPVVLIIPEEAGLTSTGHRRRRAVLQLDAVASRRRVRVRLSLPCRLVQDDSGKVCRLHLPARPPTATCSTTPPRASCCATGDIGGEHRRCARPTLPSAPSTASPAASTPRPA